MILQDDDKFNTLFRKSSLVGLSDYYINLMVLNVNLLARYLDVENNSVRSTLLSLALFKKKNLKTFFIVSENLSLS